MAQIDDRARELNERLARPDDEDDEDQGDGDDVDDEDSDEEDDDDVDEDQDDEDDENSRGPRTRAAGEGAPALSAGLVLGFLAYSAALQVIRGGTEQLSGWLKAKLINEPWTPPGGGG